MSKKKAAKPVAETPEAQEVVQDIPPQPEEEKVEVPVVEVLNPPEPEPEPLAFTNISGTRLEIEEVKIRNGESYTLTERDVMNKLFMRRLNRALELGLLVES